MIQKRAFSFIPLNARQDKPRLKGITEIRGPYYSVMGFSYLTDILETMGNFVDGLKFAGGSFALMPEKQVKAMIDLAHKHDVYVSTGGWIEHVLTYGSELTNRYIDEAKNLGFDVVEISTGFITIPDDNVLRLVERVERSGMKAKPELGIQFGAGGATQAEELEKEGTRDVNWLIDHAKRYLNAGASIIMIESEGITESVKSWRTDVVTRIVDGVGLENVMFEAADPAVFEWYVKTYGPEINLFVDHSQIVQLEALRSGIWGTKSTWGRIISLNFETQKRRFTMKQDEMLNLSPEVENCAIECVNCHSVCLRTINYCLRKGGKFASPQHIGFLFNCAEICQTAENFLLGENSTFANQICDLVASLCERTAKSCEVFGEDIQLKACAEVCRSCATSCRNIIPAQAA